MSKTLVCIIAQTRGHEVTWDKFKQNVLDQLNADLAVCIGTTKKYNYNNPFWSHAKYKWEIDEFDDDYSDAFDMAQTNYFKISKTEDKDWRKLLKIKNFWLGGIKGFTSQENQNQSESPGWNKERYGSSSILIFYRWLLLKNLEAENLINDYDQFIITRSDFYWPKKHPPLSTLDNKFIWMPDSEGYGGYCDRYVIVNKKEVKNYLSLIEPILTKPSKLYELMHKKDNWNLERYLKLYFEINGLKKKVKFFPYIMYTVFGAPNQTIEFSEYNKTNLDYMKWIYSEDKLSKTNNFIIKKPSEYLYSVIYSNLFNKHGWGNIRSIKLKFIMNLFYLILLNKFFPKKIKFPINYDTKILESALNKIQIKKFILDYFKNKYYN